MGFSAGKARHRSFSSGVVPTIDRVEPGEAIDALQDATERTAALAASADLTTPVERLGRWRAQDVVAHLGGVHEWATRIVRTSSMDGPGFRKSKLRGDELADWYVGVAADLVDALRSVDPDGVCPNFNPGSPATNGFWIRRQLHETLIHTYDLERVLADVTTIAPHIAVDTVDEHLDVFVRTRGKQTLSAPLLLESTDAAATWLLAPAAKPGRVDIDPPDAAPAATMTGAAMNLALVVWGRLTVAEAGLSVGGDEAVAASFRA